MRSAKWFSRHALIRAAGMWAALAGLSSSSGAQVVRGVVVEAGSGSALPGVVVVLLDSAGKRLAGVLVDDDGRYAIRAMVPGRYAVRAERIGYRADAPTPVTLASGETVDLRLVTRPIPGRARRRAVTGKSPCVARPPTGARYQRSGMRRGRRSLRRISRSSRSCSARACRDSSGRSTRAPARSPNIKRKEASAVTRSPFVSEPAAQLSANGYVRQNAGEIDLLRSGRRGAPLGRVPAGSLLPTAGGRREARGVDRARVRAGEGARQARHRRDALDGPEVGGAARPRVRVPRSCRTFPARRRARTSAATSSSTECRPAHGSWSGGSSGCRCSWKELLPRRAHGRSGTGPVTRRPHSAGGSPRSGRRGAGDGGTRRTPRADDRGRERPWRRLRQHANGCRSAGPASSSTGRSSRRNPRATGAS